MTAVTVRASICSASTASLYLDYTTVSDTSGASCGKRTVKCPACGCKFRTSVLGWVVCPRCGRLIDP